LVLNDGFARKVSAHLKKQYFDSPNDVLFELIDNYSKKYAQFPTKEVLFIDLDNRTDLNQDQYDSVKQTISTLQIDPNTNVQYMVDETEKFCQDKELHHAIFEAIKIIDGRSKTPKGGIPELLQKALQVGFDHHVGHDFIDDADARYKAYRHVESKIQFDIEFLNAMTDGGLPDKTISCILAPTGVGKSMMMCHMAAHNLVCSRNVLYITLEMAEERIAQRIDANLLDIPMNDLKNISKLEYDKKMEAVKKTTNGKLIIKEYPTSSAGASHFRYLLDELRIKKNFVPDIIYIDYINICCSSRVKMGSAVNTYVYIKAIAEELRGLAVEYKVPIVTATQSNRDSFGSSDIGLENTSESIGLPQTVDLMFAVIATEELDQLNQLMIKQLKNRLGDPSKNRRFVIGVDKSKMRLYNCDQSAQEDIIEGPAFDNSKFGNEESERNKPKMKFNKSKFEGFR
jgi:archaellum biogenesis ATPase FlaH